MAKLPHEKLLEESGLTKKDLPSEIVNKIKEYDMKKNKRDAKENGLKSVAIAQLMYSWMEDNGHIKTDTPPPASDTPPASTDTPPASTDTPPASTDTPPASTDTPPASTDTPPASTDTPPASTDTTPPASTDTTPASTDTPPATPPAKKKKWIPLMGWVEQ